MSVGDAVKSAYSALSALSEHFDALDEIEGKRTSAEAQLKAIALELSMASKRLAAVKVELKKAEGDLEGKRHIIHDEAARALADINRQIAARQEDERKLEVQIKEKQADLQNVLAGMAALQQRLRV